MQRIALLLIVFSLALGPTAGAGERAPLADTLKDSPGQPVPPATTGRVLLPLVAHSRAPIPTAGRPAFGVNFITSAQAPASEARYARAALTRAAYDRVPLYWWEAETAPGVFDWASHDTVIAADIEHGYKLDAILLMPPGFYIAGPCGDRSPAPDGGPRSQPRVGQRLAGSDAPAPQPPGQDCTTPVGLSSPVFSDGTDSPGPGKTINPANPWARYVYLSVERYKPGGLLAQSRNWPPGTGIRLWEIWNEPDWEWFWNGNAEGFARALKVAFLAIEQADPDAEVMFGGLSNIGVQPNWPSGRPGWLRDVLTVISSDPNPALRDQMGWYFDAVGDHNYSHAWSSWNLVYTHNNVVASFGLTGKGAWLNETGVPVCDDYPGPACPNPYRANLVESASFEIQSAAYGLYVGVDGYLHFQLYDDCGTAYDAFGFFRNPSSHTCNNGSPYPDQPRPSVTAFNLAAEHFSGVEPLWRMRPGGPDPYTGPQEWIAFYRPAGRERVLAVWARFRDDLTAAIPATGQQALLVDQYGGRSWITPVDGVYNLTLPGATNFSNYTVDGSAMIGGRPYILVETDTRPPDTTVTPLPPESPPQIVLAWNGQDLGSGVVSYEVWVSVDGGPLAAWLQTPLRTVTYPGQPGHSYGFAVRALDRAGNWGLVPATPQVSTFVP
jgi:hypothetical protein